VRTARAQADLVLTPEAALRLWTEVDRWPSFVEGFKHVERQDGRWPEVGARVRWVSTPGGRGLVTERVVAAEPPNRIVTEVFEDAMTARQTVTFSPADPPRETWVGLELDYELTAAGYLKQITDVLFIRRALAAAMDRTLGRFATEAEEQTSL